MRSDLLPSEHVFGLCVNGLVILAAGSSLLHLVPSFLNQKAQLNIIRQDVNGVQKKVDALEAKVQPI